MGIELPPKNPREASTTTRPETKPEPEPEPEPKADKDNLSRRELREAIREYAETVDLDVDLSKVGIEVSDRLTVTAGKAINHLSSTPKHGRPYTMRFAWKAYQSWGWEKFKSTIRHELIHIWQYERGSRGHGSDFKREARRLGCSVHCEPFGEEDAAYLIYCEGCGELKNTRQRRSKLVKHPERYKTRCCKADLRVEANN